MKEAEKRFELDLARSRSEGRSEWEAEAQQKSDQLERDYQRQAVVAADKVKTEREEMVADYEAKLTSQRNKLEQDKADALERQERLLTERLTREGDMKRKIAVEEAISDTALLWQSKVLVMHDIALAAVIFV